MTQLVNLKIIFFEGFLLTSKGARCNCEWICFELKNQKSVSRVDIAWVYQPPPKDNMGKA